MKIAISRITATIEGYSSILSVNKEEAAGTGVRKTQHLQARVSTLLKKEQSNTRENPTTGKDEPLSQILWSRSVLNIA